MAKPAARAAVDTRRDLVLAAAERLLRQYGPNKTTIADIAREAELGVGTVYLEFPSKDAIVEELSTRRYDELLEAMRAAASAGGPYAERLRAVFDARCRTLLRLGGLGPHARDLVHCACAGVKTAHERFLEAERALLVDLLHAGTRARELAVGDPELVARALLRAYGSFSPPFVFALPAAEVERLHAAMHELVLFGLLRRA